MIGNLAVGNKDNIDWWVSAIASRNTYATTLYFDCCRTILIKELLDEEEINEIVVASAPLAKVIKKICRERNVNVRIISKEPLLQPVLIFLHAFWVYLKDIVIQIYRLWCSRIAFPPTNSPLPANCTLIDLFVLDRSFDNGEFEDRYYNNFGGYVNEEEAKGLVYIPTLAVRLRNTCHVLRSLRKSRKRFLLLEDALKIVDYLYAWTFPVRGRRLYPPRTMLADIDVTPLIRREWMQHLFFGSSMEALLKFRFAQRLRERRISVRLIIDWFENQDIDKAANAGFRKYYPEVPVIGYQGFDTQKYYLCAYPISEEYKSRVLPNTVAVCGRSLMEERKQFCQNLDVITAPAFRYSRVWKERAMRKSSGKFRVLILLPLDMDSAVSIIRSVTELLAISSVSDIQFLLKPHPAARLEIILERACLSLPPAIDLCDGDFFDYIEHVDVVMGNTSSALLESVAMGIPAIINGVRNGITHNPIPDSIPQDIWRLCYSVDEMAQAINHFRSLTDEDRNNLVAIGNDVRESFFEQVTKKSVRAFLRLAVD